MRVLFDQNLPHKLRTSLASLGPRHEIVTAAYMGWGELKNGELLRTAEAPGMEVLVTGDGTLAYEQNLTGRRLAIVALSTNNWPIVKNHVPQILAAIDSAAPDRFKLWTAEGLAESTSKKARANRGVDVCQRATPLPCPTPFRDFALDLTPAQRLQARRGDPVADLSQVPTQL